MQGVGVQVQVNGVQAMKLTKDAHDGPFSFDYLAYPHYIAKMVHGHLKMLFKQGSGKGFQKAMKLNTRLKELYSSWQ
jgi:hypothetical protein